VQPWVRLVRAIAVVGVVVASASITEFVLGSLARLGISSPLPFGRAPTVRWMLAPVPAVLLFAGSIGCLSLRPLGRRLMIWYAVAALGVIALWFTFNMATVFTNTSNLRRGLDRMVAYALSLGLSSVPGAAFPCVVLAVMVQTPVRRLFER
jgi:hypothetical protein